MSEQPKEKQVKDPVQSATSQILEAKAKEVAAKVKSKVDEYLKAEKLARNIKEEIVTLIEESKEEKADLTSVLKALGV